MYSVKNKLDLLEHLNERYSSDIKGYSKSIELDTDIAEMMIYDMIEEGKIKKRKKPIGSTGNYSISITPKGKKHLLMPELLEKETKEQTSSPNISINPVFNNSPTYYSTQNHSAPQSTDNNKPTATNQKIGIFLKFTGIIIALCSLLYAIYQNYN